MKNLILFAMLLILPLATVSAHVLYRDILVNNLDRTGAFIGYLYNNYGWIDGADTAINDTYPLGDTHQVYWTRLSLPAESHISLRVQALNALNSNDSFRGSEMPYRIDFSPGFTLYNGLAPSLAHDSASPDCVQEGDVCHGVFDALNSFTLWNSLGQNTTIDYIGHGTANTDHPHVALGQFYHLPAGNYSLVIGGGNPEGIPHGVGMPLGIRPFSVSVAVVPAINGPSSPSLSRQYSFSGRLSADQPQKRYRVRCRSSGDIKTDRYWFAISGLTPKSPKLTLTVQKNGETHFVTDSYSGDFAFSPWSTVGKGNGFYELVISRAETTEKIPAEGQEFTIKHACGTELGQLTALSKPAPE